jgi:hypothetical protein
MFLENNLAYYFPKIDFLAFLVKNEGGKGENYQNKIANYHNTDVILIGQIFLKYLSISKIKLVLYIH